jgi:hypothetical protein
MRRRQFLGLAGGVVAQPRAVRAQKAERVPLVGVLMASGQSSTEYRNLFAAFDDGLRMLGWKDRQKLRDRDAMGRFSTLI